MVAGGSSLVRATRCSVLRRAGVEVVSDSPDVTAALEAAEVRGASLVLLDAAVEGGCVAAVRRLLDSIPGLVVLVVAPHLDARVLLAAVRAGAKGLVTEAASSTGFARAVEAALNGEAVVPRRGVATLIDQVRVQARGPAAAAEPGLTRRESEVLALLRDGLTPKQVALELRVSAATVRRHRAGLRRAAAERQARPASLALESMS